jgi:hypothetical protein
LTAVGGEPGRCARHPGLVGPSAHPTARPASVTRVASKVARSGRTHRRKFASWCAARRTHRRRYPPVFAPPRKPATASTPLYPCDQRAVNAHPTGELPNPSLALGGPGLGIHAQRHRPLAAFRLQAGGRIVRPPMRRCRGLRRRAGMRHPWRLLAGIVPAESAIHGPGHPCHNPPHRAASLRVHARIVRATTVS